MLSGPGTEFPDKFAGQKHTTGFPADHARAHHTCFDRHIIPGGKMLTDQLTDLLILGGHHAAHLVQIFLLQIAFRQSQTHLQEEILPGILHLLSRPGLVENRIIPAERCGIGHGMKAFIQINPVRQEHLAMITVFHFQRRQIIAGPGKEHIQKNLHRLPNPRNGIIGMNAVSNRINRGGLRFPDKRTGHPNKIIHHKIRIPGDLQFRETVKQKKRPRTRLLNNLMHAQRKQLKPLRRIHLPNLQAIPDLC